MLSPSSVRDLMQRGKLNSEVREIQVQHFSLVSDTRMGNWGKFSESWFRDPSLKQILKKNVILDVVHISIPLKHRLSRLVGKKSCLFSPCSVGCSHSCETVKHCPRGSAILLWKWIQKCDILLAWTGGACKSLTDCHRFAWWIDSHHCWAKIHWFCSFSSSGWPS